jgi:predicted phosphodiesterase
MIENGKEVYRPRLSSEDIDFFRQAKQMGITDLSSLLPIEDSFDVPFLGDDGIEELPEPLIVECKEALILNDLHFPIHDRTAIETAVNYGRRKRELDLIVLNGDIFDFGSLSLKYHCTPSRLMALPEFKLVKQFFEYIRQVFPKQRIIFKKGNHDERYDLIIESKIPQFDGIESMKLESIANFSNYGIEMAKDLQEIRIGKLSVFHGHELKKGGLYYTSGILNKLMCNVAVGHFHRTQESSAHTLHGENIACFGVGCLSKLRTKYMPYPNANHGFGYVKFASNGTFEFDNKRIINGKAM